MPAKTSGAAEDAAMKILGDQGKIPPPEKVLGKPVDNREAAAKDFGDKAAALNSSVLALQNALSGEANAVENYINTIEKSDFGLDKNNRENAKKIAAASKVLVAYWDTVKKNLEKEVKSLDAFDKHLDDFDPAKL
jgi:hypothetical protein